MTPSASSSASRRAGATGRPLLLLDTNALLRMIRPGAPWLDEAARLLGAPRVAVPTAVLRELERLERREVRGARAALELAGRFPSIEVTGRGDSAILRAARDHRATVLTADRRFVERLREAGIPALVPRDQSRLELRPGRLRPEERPSVRATVKKRSRLGTTDETGEGSRARR